MRTILENMERMENGKTSLHAWVMLALDLMDEQTFEHLKWLQEHGEVTITKYVGLEGEGIAKIVGTGILKKIVFENVKKLETQK